MKLGNLAAIGLIAALAVAQAPAQTVRVGTFHKASIVVAFDERTRTIVRGLK